MNTVTCPTCESPFTQRNNFQKYCSLPCRRVEYRKPGKLESTEHQYQYISGNWERYFNRLCVRSFKRNELTSSICIDILKEQGYRCALSGVELTCILQKGTKCKTNASIDRKDPKGPYTRENVHLVCAAINKFRIDLPLDEFIDWCKKVANYAICQ